MFESGARYLMTFFFPSVSLRCFGAAFGCAIAE
jgi:hypothetical protein